PGWIQHPRDRCATAHHQRLRQETGRALPATGSGTLRQGSPMTREELFEVMEKIAAEREAARPIVAQLIASGEPIEDVEIPEGWRTAGMVMELTAASDVIQEAEPSRSREFAQLALAATTGITSDP